MTSILNETDMAMGFRGRCERHSGYLHSACVVSSSVYKVIGQLGNVNGQVGPEPSLRLCSAERSGRGKCHHPNDSLIRLGISR